MKNQFLEQRNNFIISYINILIVGIFGLTMQSCSKNTASISLHEPSSKIKLVIENALGIDNIIFTKFGGFTEEDVKPFKPYMEITLDEPMNDLYQILLQKGEEYIPSQIWLKGNDITIKGNIDNDELKIDTIINSPFYYYTIDAISKYSKLNNKNQTQEELNNSLLVEIKNNLNSPFSNSLASIYINMNLDNAKNLKDLQRTLSTQSDYIKDHFLSVHTTLRNIVNVKSIHLDTFKFNNVLGNSAKLPFKSDAVYMLDFWFINCAPCIADHKILQSNINLFHESGVEIIGISTDYNQSEWIEFLDKKTYTWKNYIEVNEITLSRHIGISSYPTYLIIKGNGRILNRSNSLEKSLAFIKEIKFLEKE